VLHACVCTGSKAIGSVITNAFSDSLTHLVHYGGMIALFVSALSLYVARYMGSKFDEYNETGYIVGDSDTVSATQQQRNNDGFALVDTGSGAVHDSDSDNDSNSSTDTATDVHKVTSPDYTELDTHHKHIVSKNNSSVSRDESDSGSSDAVSNGIQMQELQSSRNSDNHIATAAHTDTIADTANV
jgi:hypothetical protein